ncbi:MAG: hypothetical protein PVF58_03825 [Candidatus Methanofastidiosia archaeon]
MKYSQMPLVILLFIGIINGCIHQRHTGPLVYFEEFTVEFEELPLLGKFVDLICTVTQMEHSAERFLKEDVVIEVELPEGFELVDGTLKWEGHVNPNQTKTHIVTVKAVKPGKWTISVWGGPSYYPHYDAESLYYCSNVATMRFLFMLPTYPGGYLLPYMATEIKNPNTFFYHIMYPQLKTPFIYPFNTSPFSMSIKNFARSYPTSNQTKKIEIRRLYTIEIYTRIINPPIIALKSKFQLNRIFVKSQHRKIYKLVIVITNKNMRFPIEMEKGVDYYGKKKARTGKEDREST